MPPSEVEMFCLFWVSGLPTAAAEEDCAPVPGKISFNRRRWQPHNVVKTVLIHASIYQPFQVHFSVLVDLSRLKLDRIEDKLGRRSHFLINIK